MELMIEPVAFFGIEADADFFDKRIRLTVDKSDMIAGTLLFGV